MNVLEFVRLNNQGEDGGKHQMTEYFSVWALNYDKEEEKRGLTSEIVARRPKAAFVLALIWNSKRGFSLRFQQSSFVHWSIWAYCTVAAFQATLCIIWCVKWENNRKRNWRKVRPLMAFSTKAIEKPSCEVCALSPAAQMWRGSCLQQWNPQQKLPNFNWVLLIPGRKRKKKILARFRFIKQPPTEPDRPFIGWSLFNHFGWCGTLHKIENTFFKNCQIWHWTPAQLSGSDWFGV